MRPKTVSATDAKNRFGGVLREVTQTDEPIVVERDGKPVAVILSMSAYQRLLPKERPLTLKEFPGHLRIWLVGESG